MSTKNCKLQYNPYHNTNFPIDPPCTLMSSPIILFNNDKNDDLFHRRNHTTISSSHRRNILHPWEKRKDSNNDASAAHSFTFNAAEI